MEQQCGFRGSSPGCLGHFGSAYECLHNRSVHQVCVPCEFVLIFFKLMSFLIPYLIFQSSSSDLNFASTFQTLWRQRHPPRGLLQPTSGGKIDRSGVREGKSRFKFFFGWRESLEFSGGPWGFGR